MRLLIVTGALLLLMVGCASRVRSEMRAELEEARLNAVLGVENYTSLISARRTLGYIGSALLRRERFVELEALLAEYEQSDTSFGDFTSPSQYLYAGFLENYIGEREDLEYFLARWKEHSPQSKYPPLVLVSLRSQLLKRESRWHNMDERQRLGMKGAQAHLAIHQASQMSEVLESPEFWESRLKVGLIMAASPESMDLLLSEVVSRDPERWTAYAMRAYRQAPRWTGGNYVQYLQEVDRLTEQYGSEVYAACAWFLYLENGFNTSALQEAGFEWEKIVAGFEALIERYPDSRVFPGYLAHLAVILERPEAENYVLELGDNLDPSSFGHHDFRRRVETMLGQDVLPGQIRRATIPVGPEKALLERVSTFRMAKLRREVSSLLMEEKFETLEQVASKVRGQDFPTVAFYKACLEDGPRFDAPPLEKSLALWSEAIPDSGTVDAIKGALLVTQAWEARGGGWARDVSDEAWKEFRRLLDQAVLALENPQDTYACRIRITAAMGRGESLSEVNRLVALAREYNPDSVLALSAKAVYLLPRWKGSKELLARFFEEEMERSGDGVLPRIVEESGYRDAMLEDLPEELVERGIVAGRDDSFEARWAATDLKVVLAKTKGDRKKALEALHEIEELQTIYSWTQGEFELWKNWAEGAEFLVEAKAKVIEAGQYSSVLPKPKRVGQANDTLEIIPGRSLGIRLRYETDETSFSLRTLVLERPGPKGVGDLIRQEQFQRWVPGSISAGDEELLLWDIEEGEHQPGVWKLSVLVDRKLIAAQEFQMVSSQTPSEPGLRLDYQGPLRVDDYTGFQFPQEPQEPLQAKLGTRFGAYIRYIAKPTSASFEWELPRVAGKAVTEGARIDCSGVDRELNPQNDFSFVLEKPEELVPGNWKLRFELNERPIGALDFELRRPAE